VLNVNVDAEKLLRLCGEQVQKCGGDIFEFTEFARVHIWSEGLTVEARNLKTGAPVRLSGRICVDAMGSASPIARQLAGGEPFDSVCPTVGAVLEGFEPGVWDRQLGDVLYSHGDISRGRQLIWELFPGKGEELTFYLFYYHALHPQNPGSLLDLYEDFFAILPEYKRCDPEKLTFKKATFGYIPAGSALDPKKRRVAFDRLLAIGDAASLQSPLVFTGFGSLVRNLPRLCELVHTALQHNLLKAADLELVRAFQSNVAVTWLFARAMMVPTGRRLNPERINAILNTYFGILAESPAEVVETFLKDRLGWLEFNKLALQAAFKNPALLTWAIDLIGPATLGRWLPAYARFSCDALVSALLSGWVPGLVRSGQRLLERTSPRLWYRLLAWSYSLTYGVGRPERGGTVLPEL
jgi:lycopene cyclase CruA